MLTFIKAMRAHQWVKNLLVFLPLVLSHQIANVSTAKLALLAFIAFSLIASTIYILNDIFDIESDRRDPIKCKRPIASGAISVTAGYSLAGILCASSLSIATLINHEFVYICIIYAALVMIYTLFVKKIYVLDVIMLSSFYVIRVIAGALAIGAEITNWLIAFSLFFFSSLAFIKRLAELQRSSIQASAAISGRDYIVNDRAMIEIVGVGMGLISVMILMLYINEQQLIHMYSHPVWLWGLSVVMLYWIMRIWFMTNRGLVHSDPIVHAIKDWPTYVMAALSLVCIYLAI